MIDTLGALPLEEQARRLRCDAEFYLELAAQAQARNLDLAECCRQLLRSATPIGGDRLALPADRLQELQLLLGD